MNLRGVFLKQLGELLDMERTLADDVLPDLLTQVHNDKLRAALDEHLMQTRGHVVNLEHVYGKLGEKPKAVKSHGFGGLRKQHEESLSGVAGLALRDMLHAAAAAHTEHYEVSAYHSLIHAAELLGEPDAVRLLDHNLHQEEEALEKLEKAIPERLSADLLKS